MQYPWGYVLPVSHIISTHESYPQYPWVISSLPVRICSTHESYPQYPWGNFHSFFIHINLLTGTAYPQEYWGHDSRELHTLTGTEDMTHRYCISSRVLRIWLTGTEYPHGYWGYDSRVLRIWLMGTAYPHRYWGYDSRVLRIWLTGTAYPHGYWRYDSWVLRIWLTGTEDMTHRYWGYDSQVLHILTGTEDMTHGYWIPSRALKIWLTGTEDMTHGYWWYDSRVIHILMGTAYSFYRVVLRKWVRRTVKEIWLLWHFWYDFKGNFVCPAFLQFWCNVVHCKLLIKTDSSAICVPCMLEHVCYEPLSLKNCRFGRYFMWIGWILCTANFPKEVLQDMIHRITSKEWTSIDKPKSEWES